MGLPKPFRITLQVEKLQLYELLYELLQPSGEPSTWFPLERLVQCKLLACSCSEFVERPVNRQPDFRARITYN